MSSQPSTTEGRRSGPPRQSRWISVGILAVLAIVFVIIWHPVLLGRRSLVGLDLLFQLPPWVGMPGAHPGRNSIVWDTAQALYPWFVSVRNELLAGRLPLWDPLALTGRPLMANAISGVFSPFTWIGLPFPPAVGMGIGMLAKYWVAGLGMALFVRRLGCGPVPSSIAGVSYATASFLVVWLGWPHSSVAALMPWVFFGFEAFLDGRRAWALALTALAWALQLAAGHPETSLQFGIVFGCYATVRCVTAVARARQAFIGVVAAVLLGTAIAGIQLLPFVARVRETTVLSDRKVSTGHLQWSSVATWLAPNVKGNPGIDRIWDGNDPNYNEAVGFVGVGALVLAVAGVLRHRRTLRAGVWVLAASCAVSAAIVYGPLASFATHVPLLGLTATRRLLGVMCFATAALAGLGAEAILQRPARQSTNGVALWIAGAGAGSLVGLVAIGWLVWSRGAGVDQVLPPFHGLIGVWLVAAGLSLAAAGCFLALGVGFARPRLSVVGFLALAIVEGALFSGPFNPQVPLAEAPPRGAVVEWLQAHASDRTIVGLESALIPETASLYGLHDARGLDPLISERVLAFWSRADPAMDPSSRIVLLHKPNARWMAMAGVAYVVADREYALPGTSAAFTADGVTIAAVPDARPFVSLVDQTTSWPDMASALANLQPDGPVTIEGPGITAQARDGTMGGHADVLERRGGHLLLDVTAGADTTLVVLQSFSPGWRAWVDGTPTPIHAANVLFQAIRVPAGQHKVLFSYQPDSVRHGAMLSGAGVLGLLVGMVFVRRAGRLRPGIDHVVE